MVGTYKFGFWRVVLLFVLPTYLVTTFNAQSVATSVNRHQSSAQTSPLVVAGIEAFERNDLKAARESFQKALAKNHRDVDAHTYLGLIADRAGKLDEAEQHFLAAVKSAPNLPSARNNYGAILMRAGRIKDAAAQFAASLRLDQNQPNALVNLAQIHFSAGTPSDLNSAAQLFERAYRIRPDLDIARALTIVSLRRHDYTNTPRLYREYLERLKNESNTPAHSVQSRIDLGAALLEAQLLAEAETELTAALGLDNSNVQAVILLARIHLARNNLPSAGKTLEAAIARGVDAAPVYALLAEVYEKTGHFENAIPALRLAIQRDPQSEKYRFAYGVLLTNAYAPGAAAIRLEEALKLFPSSPRLWFALGLAHFKHDQDSEANVAFRRAIELDTKFAPAFAYLGLLAVRAGAYKDSLEYYAKALEVDPNLAVVHYLVADSLLKQTNAQPERIEASLRRAVALDDSFTPARLSLGKLFMREKRWTEAIKELEKVTELDPNEAEAYYHLGRAYGRLKRSVEADVALATFKRLSETKKAREDTELRLIVKRLSNVRF